MNRRETTDAATRFALQWAGRGKEKAESQKFWLQLLREVFGIENSEDYILFEETVKLDHTSFMDGFIPSEKVLIEQKSIDSNLMTPIRQSDGSLLTPFQQAKRYAKQVYEEKGINMTPRWIICCNFQEFHVYDMERPNDEPSKILLKDFAENYHRLSFLVGNKRVRIEQELKISAQAATIVGELYDALLKQYIDPSSESSLRSLNVLCVRLVFCLYAEDAGVFPERNQFFYYLDSFRDANARQGLIDLFRVLNQKSEERDPYLDEKLSAFPYVNGGLFAEENIEIPRLTPEILTLIKHKASLGIDWSGISPTIFGAMFESTLNPATRRSGGMHYTSVENIHRLIGPLFLDNLTRRFEEIMQMPASERRKRDRQLEALQNEMASLTFLDPACGSGNFLTETYMSLRRLENEIIKALREKGGALQSSIGFEKQSPVKVGIHQFYGIEINDFAVTVARTALWIAEAQMLAETEAIVSADLDFLPLKSYPNIVEADALRKPWEEVIDRSRLSYIIGNPPFVGARWMNESQKVALLDTFGKKWKNTGNLDLVAGWYKKAADYMDGTPIRAALVSTNSIAQGSQVADLWQPLVQENRIHIDFAWPTFVWDNQADHKAHVHVVIIGFSQADSKIPPRLFSDSGVKEVTHISPYLIEGSDVFVVSRSKPICNVPEIGIGNKPIDDGNYIFSKEEMEEFIKKEPASAPLFHPFYGAQEFIHRKPRYCLWLGECTPAQLKSMPYCLDRVKRVREFRLTSKSEGTLKLADRPTRFHVENIPKDNFIVIPQVSSEKRRYIPIGFMEPGVICSDKLRLMPGGDLYVFGILTSNVHMAWMRIVSGRLKSDYSYSKDIVYNNFPWPEADEKQRQEIEKTAQAILDARALYPDSSLADLYDEALMPVELRRAHQANDRAVMKLYGFPISISESECVSRLFNLYTLKTGS